MRTGTSAAGISAVAEEAVITGSGVISVTTPHSYGADVIGADVSVIAENVVGGSVTCTA
jgi:hypothetical protein